MDLLNRRSVLRFLLAASFSVLHVTSSLSVAQEPVPTEASVPPVVLDTWYADWSVTCYNSNGTSTRTEGRATGVTCYKAEKNAENAADLVANQCSTTPPPDIDVKSCKPMGGFAISESRGHENPCPSLGESDWIVRYECTGRNGGTVAKEARGTTYCEALAKAREYVCRKINSDVYGGACRCCTRVIQRPVCCQLCVPRKKR